MFFQQEVGGRETMAGEAARADRLDLEAAEQLIQLSGGEGGDDGVSSESRSADSVTCCEPNQAGVKEAAVESRLKRRRFVAGKNDGGNAGKPDRRSANKCYRVAGTEEIEAKGTKQEEPPAVESRPRRSVVDDGEERRRPKFRWLADVYRETRQLTT